MSCLIFLLSLNQCKALIILQIPDVDLVFLFYLKLHVRNTQIQDNENKLVFEFWLFGGCFFILSWKCGKSGSPWNVRFNFHHFDGRKHNNNYSNPSILSGNVHFNVCRFVHRILRTAFQVCSLKLNFYAVVKLYDENKCNKNHVNKYSSIMRNYKYLSLFLNIVFLRYYGNPRKETSVYYYAGLGKQENKWICIVAFLQR